MNREQAIPRRPLLWLAAGLLFTIPPMFTALPLWVPLGFLAALLAKFFLEHRGLRLRSLTLKLALVAAALASVALTFPTLRGAEPMTAVFLLLVAVKILEAHTARDFHVLVLFSWFLCLWGFLVSQDLLTGAEVFIGFSLLCVAMLQFHAGNGAPAGVSLRLGAKLLGQTLPVVALCFVFFPRGSFGLKMSGIFGTSSATGFAESLKPGSVTQLATSRDTAFRVDFPDGRVPPPTTRYWRGAVLWQSDGLDWGKGEPQGAPAIPTATGPVVRQRILLQPHGQQWLFALDRPVAVPADAIWEKGGILEATRRVRIARRYETTSAVRVRDPNLSSDERTSSLRLPQQVSPRVQALVNSWTAQTRDPQALANLALGYFREQGFEYSLAPGEYGGDSLDEFLFQRRMGFCEHFAGALATLLRVARVPSRVVVGYQGGEYNETGKFLTVRQADAHAWVEAWIPGQGWQRLDATMVVAPTRLEQGMDAFIAGREAGDAAGAFGGGNLGSDFLRRSFVLGLRQGWDSLVYAWDTRVAGFDREAQEEFLLTINLKGLGSKALLWRAALAVVALVAVYFGWMWWRARPRGDRVVRLYAQFCDRAAALGVVRSPSEGPSAFAQRVKTELPARAEEVDGIADVYVRLRYAPAAEHSLLRELAQRVRRFPS